MTIERALELILGNLGVLFLLLAILVGGWKKIWVWGWYATELTRRVDKLENKLDEQIAISKTSTTQLTRVVDIAEKRQGTNAGV